jgi:hypothetical protein
VQCAGVGQDRDLAPVVEEIGKPLQVFCRRQAGRREVDGRGFRGTGRGNVLPGVGVRVGDLDVVGTVMCATPGRA